MNEVLLKDSHAHSFPCRLRLAAFKLQGQRWVVTAQTVRPAKPEIFTLWPFPEVYPNLPG